MTVRTDPFRELDRFAAQLFGGPARPAAIPMDAWREGERFVLEFDLPAVDPDSVDIDVERNVLTVKAERRAPVADGAKVITVERPRGKLSRRIVLGDNLDRDRIAATYDAGVLRLTIPVAEQAKSRKIVIGSTVEPAVSQSEPAVSQSEPAAA